VPCCTHLGLPDAIFICRKWFFRARGMKNAQAKADILGTSDIRTKEVDL